MVSGSLLLIVIIQNALGSAKMALRDGVSSSERIMFSALRAYSSTITDVNVGRKPGFSAEVLGQQKPSVTD